MTLPNGWSRCARCAVATETAQLDPRGVCWRCQPTTGECAQCSGLMEYCTENPDYSYWRHVGNPPGREHGATAGRIAS